MENLLKLQKYGLLIRACASWRAGAGAGGGQAALCASAHVRAKRPHETAEANFCIATRAYCVFSIFSMVVVHGGVRVLSLGHRDAVVNAQNGDGGLGRVSPSRTGTHAAVVGHTSVANRIILILDMAGSSTPALTLSRTLPAGRHAPGFVSTCALGLPCERRPPTHPSRGRGRCACSASCRARSGRRGGTHGGELRGPWHRTRLHTAEQRLSTPTPPEATHR
jgi:hypothetical protein